MARSTEQMISNILSKLSVLQPTLAQEQGEIIYDLATAIATEFQDVIAENTILENLLFLQNPDDIPEADLDLYAGRYDITRLAATPATSTVLFYSSTVFTISGGSQVRTNSTDTTTAIGYSTTNTTPVTAAYNPDTGRYEARIPVVCSSSGTIGNVGANTIVVISFSAQGVSVTNETSITNGTDRETNTELLNRIKLFYSGNVLGTLDGYTRVFSQNDEVAQAYVVGPNSQYAERGAGAIDIYIDGEITESFSQEVPAASPGEVEVLLNKTPALSITNISGYSSTDYELVKDETTAYRFSVNAKDKLRWLITPPTTSYTIEGTYNKLISDLQEQEIADETHILTNDVLFKAVTAELINIEFTVYKLAGYSASVIESSLKTAIDNYIATAKVGKNIRQSDIVAIIESVEGVDYVTIPLQRLSLRSNTGVSDLILTSPFKYFATDANTYAIEVL